MIRVRFSLLLFLKINKQIKISFFALYIWFTFSSKAWAMNMLCWKWTLSSRVPCSSRNRLNLFQNIIIIFCSAVNYLRHRPLLPQWGFKAHVLVNSKCCGPILDKTGKWEKKSRARDICVIFQTVAEMQLAVIYFLNHQLTYRK